MRAVHYMIRKPGVAGQLIYPAELDTMEAYHGFGSFFLPGSSGSALDSSYTFWAIQNNDRIETTIEKQSESNFLATVIGIGQFLFKSRIFYPPLKYVGASELVDDESFAHQLIPHDHDNFNRAVKERGFYFVGFTPMIETYR